MEQLEQAPSSDQDPDDFPWQRTPLSRRGKVRRAALATLVVVLAVVALIGTQPDLRAVFIPTPPPPPSSRAPSALSVRVRSNVLWATIWLDGHLAAASPDSFVTLGPGRHDIEVRAAPFHPVHCLLTVPVRKVPDCQVVYDEENVQPVLDEVDLSFTLADLDAPQRASVIAALNRALVTESRSGSVPAGEQIAPPPGRRTAAPLPAALTYTIPKPTVADLQAGQEGSPDCRLLCATPGVTAATPPALSGCPDPWPVEAPLVPLWRFSAPSGVTSLQPAWPGELDAMGHPSYLIRDYGMDSWPLAQMALCYQAGHWTAATLMSPADLWSSVCSALPIQGTFTSPGSPIFPQPPFLVSHEDPAAPFDGCLVVIGWGPQTKLTLTSPTQAFYLVRWGLVVTLNAVAQRYASRLPVATPADEAAAQRILALAQP